MPLDILTIFEFCRFTKLIKLKRLQNNFNNSSIAASFVSELYGTLLTIISVGCEVVVRWMAEVDHFLSLIVIAYN
ncbi:hypothetical protein T4B_10485 [Trichinella pseudospiralis]|uniref:Uncharacterized protein n=1 Tax=Trichinella pseudospiralis TaxID=6337 RepID=A0A0V1IG72_TRIPS|nr:hypothetical protein T4B_10485 [Trichinella pseudospiralis]